MLRARPVRRGWRKRRRRPKASLFGTKADLAEAQARVAAYEAALATAPKLTR